VPRPLPDPSPGALARLRKAAEQLRAAQDEGHQHDDSTPTSAEPDYESWTLARLRRRAAELDVAGRSTMDRAELVAALRTEQAGPRDDGTISQDDPTVAQ
jgi:hypothetical protein